MLLWARGQAGRAHAGAFNQAHSHEGYANGLEGHMELSLQLGTSYHCVGLCCASVALLMLSCFHALMLSCFAHALTSGVG